MFYHSDLPSRFVVIPRHSAAKHQEIRLLDTEPCHVRKMAEYVAAYKCVHAIDISLDYAVYISVSFRSSTLGTLSREAAMSSRSMRSASVQSST